MFSFKTFNIFFYLICLSMMSSHLVGGVYYNGLGLIFMWLTLYLNIMCVLCSLSTIKYNMNFFYFLILLKTFILTGVFLTENMLVFYILFESTLMPIFILIIGWGSSEEKVSAGYYLFFFTLLSSLLMLLAMIKLYLLTGSLNVSYLKQVNLPLSTQKYCFACFSLAMAVKMPMFPFHMWLPQAHVEAPLAGSVLLAGILLKLGGYGFIYFILPLFPFGFYYFSNILQWLSMLGIVYGGLTTLSQSDMKSLIAYSSVAHMGFATFALFSVESEMGVISSLLMLIAHGFVSPALFIMVGLLYESFGTRVIKYYKGVGVSMPLLDSYVFLFTLSSIAFPGSLNFMGEFLVMITATQVNFIYAIIVSMGAFMGLKYAFYFYESIFKGEWSNHLHQVSELIKVEWVCLLLLFMPVMLLGVLPSTLLCLL